MLNVRIKNSIVNLEDVSMIECVEERLLITLKCGVTKIIRFESTKDCEEMFIEMWRKVK